MEKEYLKKLTFPKLLDKLIETQLSKEDVNILKTEILDRYSKSNLTIKGYLKK